MHGDLYHEGKEFEVKAVESRPGVLSADLKQALSMPVDVAESGGAPPVPPPWLINMQRYGMPPSYPSLKIPGLNAPLPSGASYGYHTGGWGNGGLHGRGLYGDQYGPVHQEVEDADAAPEPGSAGASGGKLWGELESEEESDEEGTGGEGDFDVYVFILSALTCLPLLLLMLSPTEEEDGSDDGGDDDGGDDLEATTMDTGMQSVDPTGLASTATGLETPDSLDVRDGTAAAPQLYRVLEEQKTHISGLMGSDKVYNVSGTDLAAAASGNEPMGDDTGSTGREATAKGDHMGLVGKSKGSDINLSLTEEELANMDEAQLKAKYESHLAVSFV